VLVAFSQKGSGSEIAFHDLTHTGQELQRHSGAMTSRGQAMSRDGSLIAATGDGAIRIFDPVTGKLAGLPLDGHLYQIYGIAFSADGQRVISSASAREAIKLWDLVTRQELLHHALRSAKHLLALINDVLDLARIEAGRVQYELLDIDLAKVLGEVGDTLEVQARDKDLEFWLSPGPAGVRVVVDESRLRQVLMNIVGNSLKFTTKGRVSISVDAPPGAPFVDIVVQDTGIGIPEERRDRLFKKFSQADASTTRRFGGTGLGLVIVKELVEAMGGSIHLESEGAGKGTTATISLPRAANREESASPATER
jgi:signal transduction histidine kinase